MVGVLVAFSAFFGSIIHIAAWAFGVIEVAKKPYIYKHQVRQRLASFGR
jgi:hypothetical protein